MVKRAGCKKLTLVERKKLYSYRRWGYGIRAIARELGRNPSTISRELKRNAEYIDRNSDYIEHAHAAQSAAHKRRSHASIRIRLGALWIQDYVEEKLKQGVSPELAAGRLSVDYPGASVSYEAVYQWIYTERKDLIKHLIYAGKIRRKRSGKKKRRCKYPAPPKRSIEERPEYINNREVVGHWEGDLVLSGRTKSAILTLKERKTRFRLYMKLPNRNGATVKGAIVQVLLSLPPALRRSLTLDNGAENSLHPEIEQALSMLVYFCHPYCSSEKGAVENANRHLRKFIPKKTNLSLVAHHQVAQAQNFWNERPMKCLGFHTPHEAFLEALAEHAH